jgi:predicted amidophosphoribosyltransferase
VWLVDDVVTTGSTLAEAARTLRRAGVEHVTAICIARTPEPGLET